MWSHRFSLVFFALHLLRIVADSQVSVTLNEEPLIEVMYQVLTPETHEGLPEAAILAGGVLDVTFTYEGEGYVAFGITTVPEKMIYSESIIAFYPTLPEKYGASQYDTSAVTRMANQTLIDASVTQDNGVTVMRFKKLLKEPGEVELTLDSANNFIWAVGTGNVLAYHRKRSYFTANLEPGEPIAVGSTVPPYKAYWKAHGIMAVLAWGIFAPLAIASSLLRAFIPGPGVWFKIHLALNMLCVVFTFVFFFIAFATTEKSGIDHFSIRHHKIGLTIFLMCLFQVASALLRPHPPTNDNEENDLSKRVNANNDVEKDDGSEGDIGVMDEKPAARKDEVHGKSVARIAFEIGHRLAGAALVALAFYNIDDGLKLYALRYGNDEDYTTAFIIWIAALLVSVACGTFYTNFLYSKDN